jgi:hypothetical protein
MQVIIIEIYATPVPTERETHPPQPCARVQCHSVPGTYAHNRVPGTCAHIHAYAYTHTCMHACDMEGFRV